MILLDILKYANICIGALFILCYSYQVFYLLIGTVVKPKKFAPAEQNNRFAFVISARNEEGVIGQLCESIRAQSYPSHLIDIFIKLCL